MFFVCYGYCGLLNMRFVNGILFVVGCCFIGYLWVEEVFVGVVKKVFYNVEEEMVRCGVFYEKVLLLFMLKVVIDGCLVIG